MKRRSFVRMTTSAALIGSGSHAAHATALAALKTEAARCGLLYGSDSDVVIAEAPLAYAALLQTNCNLFAPLLSWSTVCPQPRTSDQCWEDPNITFARQHSMRLTGGHFLWYQTIPQWVTALTTRAATERAIVDHITALGRHYAGQVYSWNVVNEAIDPSWLSDDGLRDTIFRQRFGLDYFKIGFQAARAADGNALLVYNDYDLEMDTAKAAARRRALLNLLDKLRAAAVPIDAVGLQTHLRLHAGRFNDTLYRNFLREIAARGLKIMITEMDVFDVETGDIARRDADIAALYTAVLSAALDEKAVIALTCWGLSDAYTWLTPEAEASFARPDGTPARPLPFDAAFQPKPAYHAIIAALRAAPHRT